MRHLALAGVLAIVLIGGAHGAAAMTWRVDCVDDPATALGPVLGTAASPGTAAAGDQVLISGLCTQDVVVTQSDLFVSNRFGTQQPPDADGISGQFEVAGAARVTTTGIILGWASPGASFDDDADRANVYVHDGGALVVEDCTIVNGPLLGVLASGRAAVQLFGTSVAGNGTAGAARDSGGIAAVGGATVTLGALDGTPSDTVSQLLGPALAVLSGASATIDGATLSGAAPLVASGHASVHVTATIVCAGVIAGDGASCTPASAGAPAITVTGGSQMTIDAGTTVTGAATGQALLVSATSSAMLNDALLVAGGVAATLEAADGSSIDLAGGTMTCAGALSSGPVACAAAVGGMAVAVDHLSSLLQAGIAGGDEAADTIVGGGAINEQSTTDLGRGPIGSAPSLTWTTGSANLTVNQNSSLRLSGGVAITGAVEIGQGSNGFFNFTADPGQNGTAPGSADLVSGGVSCPFNHYAMSHVTTPQNLSGGGASFVATGAVPATPGVCMTF